MAVRPCPPSAPRPPPPRMAADPAPARNSPRLRCDGAQAGREMERRAPAFGSATLRHFRRHTGSRCRRCVAVPGVFLSRPIPGHGGAGCPPHSPPPRARRCRVSTSPVPVGHGSTGCPPPRPPRARRTPRHSPGNGQSTRNGDPQVLQRYLIHPAGHRAALTPTQKPGTRSWVRGTKRPGSPRDTDCRAAGRAPGHLWIGPHLLHPPRGGQGPCDRAAPKVPQHLPAPSSMRDCVQRL